MDARRGFEGGDRDEVESWEKGEWSRGEEEEKKEKYIVGLYGNC